MRARLVRRFVLVALVAVVLLGVPLGILGRAFVQAGALRRADREADAVAYAVQPYLNADQPVPVNLVSDLVARNRRVVITDGDGTTTSYGPESVAEDGVHFTVELEGGATVDLWMPDGPSDAAQLRITLIVAGLAALSVALAALLGVLMARRLARPLDELAATARQLGQGNFTARAPRSGFEEIDDVAVALDTSAERIGTMVAAERQFAANASHQLRSPLTALRLRLEEIADTAGPDIRAEAELALRHADRLNATISELLRLARSDADRPREPVDVAALMREHAPIWEQQCAARDQQLRVELPARCVAMATSGGTVQVVQTLVDNALEHGAGTVTIEVHDEGSAVALLVSDEGTSLNDADTAKIFQRHVSSGNGTGVGLALARALAEADGGRLELVGTTPTTFRLTTLRPAMQP